MSVIAILGTLDTKGAEHAFVAEQIRAHGHDPLLIDVGTRGTPTVKPDISRVEVLVAGGFSEEALSGKNDRGECVGLIAKAAPALLAKLVEDDRIAGVISLGGGGGTAIATAAMRALPVGFPKVMVSTLAAGDIAPYVGVKDIVFIPSVVDVAGLNRLSRTIFTRAAGAVCGMVESRPDLSDSKPMIVASMFGNTTDCVTSAKGVLEEAGYEVVVFAATGTGGRAMESLIDSGMVAGALDVTTTEWADEYVGGVLGAGPDRLDAVGRMKTPSIVTPGCLDMVNFGEPSSVPEKFRDRTFYEHNPQITLMRTTPAECREIGKIIAGKINAYPAPTTFLIPMRAISVISAVGQPFHLPEADTALFEAIKTALRDDIPVIEIDASINSTVFAKACAKALLENIAKAAQSA
jgi:uncharacterized protein (UPF0261 family)